MVITSISTCRGIFAGFHRRLRLVLVSLWETNIGYLVVSFCMGLDGQK